ncbi:MAG: hypothetical protein AB7K09_03325 [Planctomycetota bacterium]
MPFVYDYLQRSIDYLPAEWRAVYARMLDEEHLDRIAARFEQFLQDGVPETYPEPHFSVECSPPMREAFAPFEPILAEWQAWSDDQSHDAEPTEAMLRRFAETMVATDARYLLILLGQRQTPASLVDARGIPPLHATLMAAANARYSEADALTVAARAWTKHSGRSDDTFWGTPKGSVKDKNEAADAIVRRILDSTTWWNMFGHFQHHTVFEARCPGGHGVRWGEDGSKFIGFLEPFDDSETF